MNEQPYIKCRFCKRNFQLEFENEGMEEMYQVCFPCQLKVQTTKDQIKLMNNMKIELYGKSIQVIIDSTQFFSVLQQTQCGICFNFTICCKVCKDEHYFCINCSDNFISNKLNLRKIQCPQQHCNQEIDHYIIVMFMKQDQFKKWGALRYNLFCPKKNCQSTIQFSPFGNFETQIIKIDNELSICSTCQINICNICWTEFKGSYLQHSNKCNSENFRNELLKNYMLDQGIAQCPKCKHYSLQDCFIQYQQVQQCQMCGTKFCLLCKTADLQLFFKKKPFHYACNCEHNFLKLKMIQIIIIVILQILYFPIGIVLFLGYFFTDFVQRKVSQINFPCKCYCYYIFYPLIIIFEIITQFFKYIIQNQHLLVNKIHKMLGIYEELRIIRLF